MAEAREKYRKLPGRRRGFIRGSSVWLGSDHLLLVNSMRFREDYKRFYLRDVQAIVMARVPRFAISTRAAAIGGLWLILYFLVANRLPAGPAILWTAAACLVATWIYVCAACSCKCRIFTAVSRDDLPSIYRTWTAREFLAEVEPRIGQVQGVLEGNWAERIEDRAIGPPIAATGMPGMTIGRPRTVAARSHTPASDIFVASLFADALLNVFTLHSLTRALQSVWYGLAFVEVAGAIAIFVQYHRGILRSGMQKLAVATLAVMGVSYYARAAVSGVVSTSNQLFPDMTVLSGYPAYVLLRQIDAGVMVVLGLVGAALALSANGEIEKPRTIAG